jgi:hypothetical protein
VGIDELLAATTAQLRDAGCVAAGEEAAELIEVAAGDLERLADLLARRAVGEPSAWLIGSVCFAGEGATVSRCSRATGHSPAGTEADARRGRTTAPAVT